MAATEAGVGVEVEVRGRAPRVLLTLVFVVERMAATAGPAASVPPARRVLLGLKKRGFGAGKWNGFGGKVEATDASIEAAAARELLEESGVRAAKLVPRGRLDFEFEGDPKILEVHVFECTELHADAATPYETDEMRPAWYDVDAIPYSKMWIDDVHWLPLVLQGESVSYYFVFRGHDIVLSRRALTDAELAECALTDRFGPAAP